METQDKATDRQRAEFAIGAIFTLLQLVVPMTPLIRAVIWFAILGLSLDVVWRGPILRKRGSLPKALLTLLLACAVATAAVLTAPKPESATLTADEIANAVVSHLPSSVQATKAPVGQSNTNHDRSNASQVMQESPSPRQATPATPVAPPSAPIRMMLDDFTLSVRVMRAEAVVAPEVSVVSVRPWSERMRAYVDTPNRSILGKRILGFGSPDIRTLFPGYDYRLDLRDVFIFPSDRYRAVFRIEGENLKSIEQPFCFTMTPSGPTGYRRCS